LGLGPLDLATAGRGDAALELEDLIAERERGALSGDGDGRPRFDDLEDQRAADRAWDATPGLDPDLRRAAAALAVGMTRQRRGGMGEREEQRRRRA